MTATARWPLHPQPGPLESLSSWLSRVARLYHLPVSELLTHNLGQPGLAVPADLDYDPPQGLLTALAERTGSGLAQLRMMTLAGWQPWLFDRLSLRPQDAQATFDSYVRANSVLLAPGEAGTNQVWKRWAGPWLCDRQRRRACPACAADPARGRVLTWRLPLMTSCTDHGCRLQDARDVELPAAANAGQPPQLVQVTGPLAALDRYTCQALTTGQVTLPGRAVHAGVWFRLLRSLLDEVSLALTTRSSHGRATLQRVWQATGLPERGGLTTWRLYEQLGPGTQEAMRCAAATALQLAADGQITARGRLGSALQPPPPRPVYDGDRPGRALRQADLARSWEQVRQDLNTMIETARTSPGAARHMLAMLTSGPQAAGSFARERRYLIGLGIPAGFLPASRDGLLATGQVTTRT